MKAPRRDPWLLRLALRAFPAEFRARYRDEMLAAHEDRAAARREAGLPAGLRLLLKTSRDVFLSGIAERLARRRSAPKGGRRMFKALGRDVRFGARMLRRRPAFTAVAIGTLAVGIGAAAAMFTLVNDVLFRPLPFPEPDRLVRVYDTYEERGSTAAQSSPANFVEWREELGDVFETVAAEVGGTATYNAVEPAEPVRAARVSAEWFAGLGVHPLLGRAFLRDEETPGGDRVVVLGHAFWRRIGGDSAIVGRTLAFEGEAHQVVGVLPASFAHPSAEVEVWFPLSFDFDVSTSRGVHFLDVFGRLAPGVTIEAANARMSAWMERAASVYPDRLAGWGVRLVSLQASIVGDASSRLMLFLGAVLVLLLAACVNAGNLLLARAIAHRRELAVRAAIGAGRGRLARQQVIEGVLIAGSAGLLGLGFAWLVLRVVSQLPSWTIPRLATVGLDATTVGLTLAGALAIGGALGLISAFLVPADPSGALRAGATGRGGVLHSRVRGALVVAQVALGLVLVVGAGLLARSLGKLMAVDPGFRVDRALMATIELPSARYPDPEAKSRFFLELTDRLERLPGVVSAAASTQVPLEGYAINFSYWIEGDDRSESDRPSGDFRVVTPRYFATAEIPILRGRAFDETDQAGGVPVIIVDETLARQEFGSGDPIGRRMTVSYGGEAGPRTIVGVVGAVRQRRLESQSYPGYYLPIQQVTWSTMRVLVRASGDPAALAESLRRETAALDPALAVRGVRTLDEHFAAAVGSPRFNALLIASFAAVTLLLALSGIYSLMTYLVTQRTHEIGVRMALGERRAQVRRAVAGTGVRLALAGVGLGLLAAAGVARLLRELLFEVGPGDPLTFLFAALTFLLVAWVGSYLPARRASGVDPLIALRGD